MENVRLACNVASAIAQPGPLLFGDGCGRMGCLPPHIRWLRVRVRGRTPGKGVKAAACASFFRCRARAREDRDNMAHRHGLTRRDFLKLSGVGLAGATLACGGSSSLIKLTAVPPAAGSSAPPVAPLATGEVADSVLVNGNIVTMDAQRSKVKALAIKDGLIRLVGDETGCTCCCGRQLADHRPARAHRDARADRCALPLERVRAARHRLRGRQLACHKYHRADASQAGREDRHRRLPANGCSARAG